MIRIKLILIFFLINFEFIFPQKNITLTQTSVSEVSYLKIDCDSSGLDIFIDNILVGQSPIDSTIPVKPGAHIVTYINPQFVTLLKEYYSTPEIESILSRSLQRVYVSKGKTVTVNLWWKPFQKHLVIRKRWIWAKTVIGLAFTSILFLLNI